MYIYLLVLVGCYYSNFLLCLLWWTDFWWVKDDLGKTSHVDSTQVVTSQRHWTLYGPFSKLNFWERNWYLQVSGTRIVLICNLTSGKTSRLCFLMTNSIWVYWTYVLEVPELVFIHHICIGSTVQFHMCICVFYSDVRTVSKLLARDLIFFN